MGEAPRLVAGGGHDQRPLFPWTRQVERPRRRRRVHRRLPGRFARFQPAWVSTGVAAGDSQIHPEGIGPVGVESPLLTFRFEEKQGPANIELNIFGYFATHLLRPVGLSGIRIA